MRKVLVALIALSLTVPVAAPAFAKQHHYYAHHYSHDRYYTNRAGHRVHSPMFSAHAPRGASAKCRDGSYSFSENHRGTCSHHGGVSSWL